MFKFLLIQFLVFVGKHQGTQLLHNTMVRVSLVCCELPNFLPKKFHYFSFTHFVVFVIGRRDLVTSRRLVQSSQWPVSLLRAGVVSIYHHVFLAHVLVCIPFCHDFVVCHGCNQSAQEKGLGCFPDD